MLSAYAILHVTLLALPLKADGVNWTELHQRTRALLQNQQNSAEAQRVLEQSIAAARQRGDTSAGFAEALNDLGTVYHDTGRFADAERAYKESLYVWTHVPGTKPKLGITLGNLAGLRLIQGRPSDAEKMYVKALAVLIAGYGNRSPEVAALLGGLTDVYSETGRYEKARQTGERALSLLQGASGDSQLGATLFVLGKVAWNQHREADAEDLMRRALEVWRRTRGPRHHSVASGLTSLAVVVSRRDPEEAGRLFRESLELIETELGPDHVLAGHALMGYARHLEARGSKREARSVKQRAETILAAHSRENRLGQTVDIRAFQRSGAR